MARRRFRYDPTADRMVEIPVDDAFVPGVTIHGELQPFRSPVDGTVISSKAQLREYLDRRGLRIHEPGSATKVVDRYAKGREDQALREQLYERTDRMLRRSDVRKFLRERR